jgi:hypothetical protein
VGWGKTAENELASLWLQAKDRRSRGDLSLPSAEEITDAANEIDHELGADPFAVGEVDPSGRGKAFCGVLFAEYQVSELDRVVSVVAVRLSRKL